MVSGPPNPAATLCGLCSEALLGLCTADRPLSVPRHHGSFSLAPGSGDSAGPAGCTGLDSSTTFQIVKCLRDFTHLRSGTVLMALLQPAPEVYDLFDDVLLMSEGAAPSCHFRVL